MMDAVRKTIDIDGRAGVGGRHTLGRSPVTPEKAAAFGCGLGLFMEDSMVNDNSSQPEADSFRGFERAFKAAAAQLKEDAKLATDALRQGQVETLSHYKMSDSQWEGLLGAARKAAQHGEKQYLLLRFPSGLCTDDSRAINNPPNDTWPETLRGEAAEIYQRWHETLKLHGFELSASVLDFPGGQPGDVGLFLSWG